MSEVISWKSGPQKFIQAKTLFRHVLSNILGDLDSKSSESKNRIVEEDLKNTIIIGSGYSIDLL